MVPPRTVGVYCVGMLGVLILSLIIISIMGAGGAAQTGMDSVSYAGSSPAAYSRGGGDYRVAPEMAKGLSSMLSTDGDGYSPPSDNSDAMIVQSADLSLLVNDVMTTSTGISEHVKSVKGFVVRSSSYGTTAKGTVQQMSMTVRVPSETFDSVLEKMRSFAKVVSAQSVQGVDVSEQVVDTQARIRTLESVHTRLMELLGKAANVADTIAVQHELMPVAEELERHKARLEYLQQSVRLSRISLNLYQYDSSPENTSTFNPLRTFLRAFRALLSAVAILLEAFIYAVVFSTPVAAVLLITYWVYKSRSAAHAAAILKQ